MGWQIVLNNSKDMAVHAALLPTGTHGKVLYYGGYLVDDTHLFDVEAQSITDIVAALSPPYNAFCGGHAFLADGRFLTAGGQVRVFDEQGKELPAPPSDEPAPNDAPHAFHGGMGWGGERRSSVFKPLLGVWEEVTPMHLDPAGHVDSGGRWYPTLLSLANGDVLAVGGHPFIKEQYPSADNLRHSNNIPERYNAGSNSWTLLGANPPASDQITADNNIAAYDFQRTHLLPDGRVFFASPVRGNNRFYDAAAGKFLATPTVALPADGKYQNISAAWTSVMLPLLHQENFRPRVLLMGGVTAQRIDLGNANPAWQQTADRQWSPDAPPQRSYVTPVILPTGQIFFTGGTAATGNQEWQPHCVLRGEFYDAGIDWQQGLYKAGTGSWSTQSVAEGAVVGRHYHGVALLLPNGAVWTAGSNGPSDVDGVSEEKRIEVFKPAYFTNGRPVITTCPTNIGYGLPFLLTTPQAANIVRVALIRCGTVTHGYNPDQRYLSVLFEHVNGTTLRVFTPALPEVAPPGRYLVWIIDDKDRPCEWASFIRISKQKALITADISTYSVQEVQALGTPAHFSNALYLVYDGFLPDEVAIPAVTLKRVNNSAVTGMTVSVGAPLYEGGAQNKDTAQRIVFPCAIDFSSQQAFDQIAVDNDFENITLSAQMHDFSSSTTLTLSKNPNPRMRDGEPPWLSIDLRAFSTQPNQTYTAGVAHGSGLNAPYDYIQSVLQAYNAQPPAVPHPFDSLPTNQDNNRLPLYSEDANGHALFNYAVARVRFRAPPGVNAADVRVFFRLWTTGWTALEYNVNGSYRRHGNGADATPLLGINGGEINNVPCFAQARSTNMETQSDSHNRRTLEGAGETEVLAYFGCWLDFNQDVKRFPLSPQGNGPYGGTLKSIQELMRGLHQCLVAEIFYTLDPTSPSATPGSSDNLAQRNLLLDESDNPGGFAAHLVHHTFQIKPSPFPLSQPVLNAASSTIAGGQRVHPDELCIQWGNLPRESQVTLYIPQMNADEVLAYAGSRNGPDTLARAGAHELHCKVGDVSFIPIPGPLATNLPALLSIQLPPSVVAGQKFRIVIRQVDGRKFRVIGTFQFDILVKTGPEILPRMTRNLAVLKHVAQAIPATDHWYPVFERYVGQLGDRIRALGFDPETIAASPTGGRPPRGGDLASTGKHSYNGQISQIIYDCFGAFEGFVLDTCSGVHEFHCRECGLETVVRRACSEHVRVTVYVREPDPYRPIRIALHCC
jgi:hypothetical protein